MPDLTARPPGRVYAVCTEVAPEVVGGLGRYAERMMAAWAGLGTPLEVFATATRASLAGAAGTFATAPGGGVRLHRVRTVGVTAGRGPGLRWQLARVVGLLVFNVVVAARILRADAGRSGSVVAVHDWMGCLAGILCGVVGRRPVVFHIHTRELAADPARRRSPVAVAIAALEATQARLARLVVVASVAMRDDLVARGWPAGRVRVVPHGFDDAELVRLVGLAADDRDRLRASIRRRYLPDGHGALVVFAGRLSPHKGVRTLIRATPHVVRRRDGVKIVLIGAQAPGTDDNAEVARLIDRVGVARHVHAGYRLVDPAEVYAHFLAADVCAFPSTYEPYGLVAVEAMALARPVVVGPGYSPEVVGDGAIRCADDSPVELAAALSRCLDDPAGADRLARRGAAHVRARATWARTAELTLATYAEAAR